MKGKSKMILIFALYVLLASSGLILFKLGSTNQNLHISIFSITIEFSWKMIIGMICYAFSFLLWLYIVSKMNLTLAMPLSVALVNTLVVVGSCLILKEKIALVQGIGIFIIILGVSLLVMQK